MFGVFSEFFLNPSGKSDICILHEYVQHAMRVQPKYVFKECGKIIIIKMQYMYTQPIHDLHTTNAWHANS